MSVVEAVESFLADAGDAAGHPLASVALALAADIDAPRTSATARSLAAKALTETIQKLEAMEPEKPAGKVSKLDELRQRRAQRGAGA